MAHKVVGKRALPLALVLAVLTAGNVMAQEDEGKKPGLFSVGLGGLLGSEFGGGVKAEVAGKESGMKFPYFGGGFFVFADAKYAELSLSMLFAGGKMKKASGGDWENDKSMSYTSFNIGLLGKYPINVSNKFVFFPLLGIDYQIMMSVKYDGEKIKKETMGSDSGDLSALWFKGGVGGDFALTTKLYLRGEALYGIRLANKFEKDMAKDPLETALGHGLTIKVGLGYRL